MIRTPGRILLRLARVFFDETVLDAVVMPTIADLQQEVRAAGEHRAQRVRAALRGYGAFWLLVAAAPVAFHRWPTRSIGSPQLTDRTPGIAFGFYMAVVLVCGWSFLGWWTLVVAGGGGLFAIAIHRWHARHPTELIVEHDNVWRVPQINFSQIPVDGNVAGLICVIGTVVVVLIGLPIARWFFLLTVALGAVSALALLAWHRDHPAHGLPQNHIVLR